MNTKKQIWWSFLTFVLCCFTLSTSLLVVAGEYTKPNVISKYGLQVNTHTGSLFHVRDDLYIPAKGIDLEVRFSYNSGETKYDYGYGGGWTNTFNIVYEKIGSNICVKRWDGNRDTFTFSGGIYTPPVGCFDSLTQYESGKFRLRTKHGLEYFFDDPTHMKVTSIRDRNGNTLTITYSGGRPTLITDANGRCLSLHWSGSIMTQISDFASPARTVHYQYDASGNPTRVVDPAGGSIRYEYDSYKRIVRLTDQRGTVTDITYNDKGAVIRIQSPLSDESFSYDTLLTQTTHSITGRTTMYTFDSLARVTDIAGVCCGYHRQFHYDTVNNIIAMIDANSNTTEYTYDKNGNRLTATDALNNTVTFTYDPVYNHVTSKQDRRGNTTTFTYDTKGNCTDIHKPLGITEHYVYDSYGDMTSYTDGRGNTTTVTYDENGYPTGVTYPIGSVSFTYDNVGNPITYTDANGNTTQNTFNALDLLTSTQNALSEVTSYAYDANGNVMTATFPSGNVLNYTRNELGMITQVTDGIGTVRTNSYDGAGNLLTSTDGNGIITTYTYNSQNLLTSTTRDGISQTYTRDPAGNIIESIDGDGHITTFTYDALNRVLSAAIGGVVTATAYNANGNVSQKTDGEGNVTRYDYDELNRLIQETFPDGSTLQYTYDANDNTGSRKNNNGDITTYLWDANNRLTKRDFPGSNDDYYTFDPGGRMLTANNNDASITYTYDGANRVLSETMNGHTTGYSYNIPARQRTITYPGGTVVQETRNLRARLVSVSRDGINVNFTYDPGSRLSSVYSSYGYTEYSYNNRDLVTAITRSYFGVSMDSVGYEYDNADNLKVLNNSARSEVYRYNDLNWLTSFKRGSLVGNDIPSPTDSSIYSYDNAGNWTSVNHGGTTTYTSNNLNQYTSSSPGGAFTYGLNGNMRASSTFGGTYNHEKNLIYGIDSITHNKGYYKYNAFGRRVQKATDSDTINYYYYGDRVIEERASNDTVTATYLYGGQWVDDVIGMTRNGATYFYLKNALGSVVAMMSSYGIAVERYEYDAFGKPTIWDPSYTTKRTSSIIGNRSMFTGREYDVEIGLYYYRARHYDPRLGRFMQRDPIGVWWDGGNRGNGYGYVSNDPISHFDPWGEAMGEPVPGAEIFVEQEPSDEPIASGGPDHGPAPVPLGLVLPGPVPVPPRPVPVPPSNAGPYSQSLSNMEDNGIIATDTGPLGGGGSGTSSNPFGGNAIRANAAGGYPVDFVGASVGDPAISGDGRRGRGRTCGFWDWCGKGLHCVHGICVHIGDPVEKPSRPKFL